MEALSLANPVLMIFEDVVSSCANRAARSIWLMIG
jgi:hypothetical protein